MAEYKCPACGKEFASQEEVAKHGQESHMANKKPETEPNHDEHNHE